MSTIRPSSRSMASSGRGRSGQRLSTGPGTRWELSMGGDFVFAGLDADLA